MDTLPYGLSESWRPFLAGGFTIAVYFLSWLTLALIFKKLLLKSHIIRHLALISWTILSTTLLFYPEKKWITEVVAAMAILGTLLLWVLIDRVFFTMYLMNG